MALVVWLKGGHTIEVIRRFVSEFTSSTGISVEVTVVDEGEAHDRLLSGGNEPDVVTVPYWYLSELLGSDVLIPVSELLENRGLDCSVFPRAATDALTRSGTLWAAPHTLTGGLLSYRTDVFDELGLPPPRSTADVLLAARAIVDARPATNGLVARASAEFSSVETYAGWAWSEGVKLLPDEGDPSPEDVEQGVSGLVETLRDCGPLDLTQRSYANVGDLVLGGTAAQMFDTSAWAFFLEDEARSRVAGRMGYTTVEGRYAPAQFLYAEGLGITRWCRRPLEAALFVAWRQSLPVLRKEVQVIGRLDVPRLDLWQTEWFDSEVARRGMTDYMAVVRHSWEQAEATHAASRPDFVPKARWLMGAISATVAGRYPSVSRALREWPAPGDRE